MLHWIIFNVIRRTVCTNVQIFYTLKNISEFNSKRYNLYINYLYPQNFVPVTFIRFNSKKMISKQNRYKENQTEDNFIDDNDDEYEYDNDNDTAIDDYLNTEKSKIIVTTVPSLRLDAIAKAGFGMSRAKVDREFYMSNIRVNGKKCFKKGIKVNLGDEIDFIQKRSPDNSNYLIINRCILLSIKTEQKEDFKIKLLQNKSLLIEEYKDKWHNDTTN